MIKYVKNKSWSNIWRAIYRARCICCVWKLCNKNLSKEKYEIYPIYISEKGDWFHYIKPVQDIDIFEIGEQPKELEKISNEFETLKKQDIIFPVLHGLYGEDGTIQGLLELLKVPYVGCKVLASGICMDKVYAK